MGKQMRLDKFLVEMGVGTRSQIKEMAKRGRIEINGLLEKKTETKIDPDKDTITCDGVKIIYNLCIFNFSVKTPAAMLPKIVATASALSAAP